MRPSAYTCRMSLDLTIGKGCEKSTLFFILTISDVAYLIPDDVLAHIRRRLAGSLHRNIAKLVVVDKLFRCLLRINSKFLMVYLVFRFHLVF